MFAIDQMTSFLTPNSTYILHTVSNRGSNTRHKVRMVYFQWLMTRLMTIN